MSHWIRIASTNDCPPGASVELVAEGRVIALVHIDGQFHALDGVCPHQGGPLGQGQVSGCILTCPWHGWQFDVPSGQSQLSQTIRQRTYSVKVQHGDVYVEVGDD